jgi:hypothetical protein
MTLITEFIVAQHPIINQVHKTIITDQDKGALGSILEVLPNVGQFHCAFHRRQNIKKKFGGGEGNRCGARLRGPKCYTPNPRAGPSFSFFGTNSYIRRARRDATISHNTQEPAKTPRPWWPSRPPLQRRGVDGSARSNVRATRPWCRARSRMKS